MLEITSEVLGLYHGVTNNVADYYTISLGTITSSNILQSSLE